MAQQLASPRQSSSSLSAAKNISTLPGPKKLKNNYAYIYNGFIFIEVFRELSKHTLYTCEYYFKGTALYLLCQVPRGRGRTNTVQDGAVDMQHGTRVMGICTCVSKATTPSKGLFTLEDPLTVLIIIYCIQLYKMQFSPLQVKNKSREGFILWPCQHGC